MQLYKITTVNQIRPGRIRWDVTDEIEITPDTDLEQIVLINGSILTHQDEEYHITENQKDPINQQPVFYTRSKPMDAIRAALQLIHVHLIRNNPIAEWTIIPQSPSKDKIVGQTEDYLITISIIKKHSTPIALLIRRQDENLPATVLVENNLTTYDINDPQFPQQISQRIHEQCGSTN